MHDDVMYYWNVGDGICNNGIVLILYYYCHKYSPAHKNYALILVV
jgi:hypothetical protein